MKKQNILLTTLLLLVMMALGYQDAAAQCPPGGGCATCNPVVTNINRDHVDLVNRVYYYSSSTSICGSACNKATGAGAYEWYIAGCPEAVVLSNGNGFARIQIPSTCASTLGLQVCMRFKAITFGGTVCWSPWYCEPI